MSSLTTKTIDFEHVLNNNVGVIGKWQVKIIIVFSIVTASPFLLFSTFGNYISHHHCRVNAFLGNNWTSEERRNLSIPPKSPKEGPAFGQDYQPCQRFRLPYRDMANMTFAQAVAFKEALNTPNLTEKCLDGWQYDLNNSEFSYSIVNDFDLVCDRASWEPLSTSIYFFGMMVGLSFWGAVADKFGRLKVAFICNAILIIVSMAVSFSPTIEVFILFRFLTAIFTNGQFNSLFVLVSEIVGIRQRNFIVFLTFVCYLVSVVYLVGVAFLFRNWRIYHAALGLASCFIFLLYFVEESPRWLIQMGRYQEALVILKNAAKMNGKEWPEELCAENFEDQTGTGNNYQSFSVKMKEAMKGFFILFRTREMRKRTIVMGLLWFTISGVYFGFVFYNVKLQGDIFVIVLLSVLTKLPSNGFQLLVYDRMGRRKPLLFCLLVTAFAALSMAIVLLIQQRDNLNNSEKHNQALVGLGTLAGALVSAAFGMLYVYTPEIFPTVLRNVGMGYCSTIARLGVIISPFLNQLRDQGLTYVPLFTYGTLSLVTGLVIFLLPETFQQKLPESVEDVERSTYQLVVSEIPMEERDDGKRS